MWIFLWKTYNIKEEMLKNNRSVFKIKPVQNKLKIDEYKPTMMLTANNAHTHSKNFRSHSKKRQISSSNKKQEQNTSSNQTKLSTNLGPLRLKSTHKQTEMSKQNIQTFQTHDNFNNSNNGNLVNTRKRKMSEGVIAKQIVSEQPKLINSETQQIVFEQLNSYTEQIINVMAKKYLLSISSGIVKIKKQKLSQILVFLTRTILRIQNQTPSSSYNLPPEITSIFENISDLNKTIIHDRNLTKLKFHSGTIKQMILVNNLDKQTQSYTKKICDLILQEKNMKEKIELLKQEFQQRSSYCQTIKDEVKKMQQTMYNAKQQHKILQNKNQQLTKNINELQKNYDELQEKGNDVFLFIQRQKTKPFLNKVSLDYKQMEIEMFDYASEMISRPQMHSYKWQPQHFLAVEKIIQSDMKRTLERIEYDNISLETKVQQMRQLIVKSMKHLRKKDEALGSIFKEKTDAIRRFVQIMDKWRSEHKMKNQYLGTMRQEYAVDSAVVEECIADMQKADKLTANMNKTIEKLRKHWDYTHSAFLFGNSFY